MFKPTQALLGRYRRLPLSTKQAGKDYYKGTRTGSMGRHTKWGGYKIDYNKVRTYVPPEYNPNFKLTPYVSMKVEKPHGNFIGYTGPTSGQRYLDNWKTVNGET